MIIFDTETTGLPLPDNASLEKQPKIIEFAALDISGHVGIPDKDFTRFMDTYLDDLKDHGESGVQGFDSLEFLCNPDEALDKKIAAKSHKLTDEDLEHEPRIIECWDKLTDFFRGSDSMVAHNLAFDLKLMKIEAMRLDKLLKFPWPSRHICTVEATMDITGSRMRLGGLYKHLFGEEMQGWHRAMADVRNLARITNELINQGYIEKC